MSLAPAIETATHAAVIPAKAYSSRCRSKNWRDFAAGRCLTDLALASIPRDRFGTVIVSTDRDDYEPITPCTIHRRPSALAGVEADVQDLLRRLIEDYQLHESYVWLLNPTSPFRDDADFRAIEQLIERTDCSAVVSVTPVSPFLWDEKEPLFRTHGRRPNTQSIDRRRYAENGMFYVFRGLEFLKHGTWYLPDCVPYVQHGLAKTVDIDTEDDFVQARRLWSLMQAGSSSPAAAETLAIEELVCEPVADHVLLLANHIRRYTAAADALHLSRYHRVLDASCGKGYGTWILAQNAGNVVGLDISPDYLRTARSAFQAGNLSFATYDEYFAQPEEPVDAVVCIETYEHLPSSEQVPFARRLFSRLKRGGTAFVTSPLGDSAAGRSNPFHLHEPTLGELHDVLRSLFEHCTYSVTSRVDSFGQDTEFCQVVLRGYVGDTTA